MCNLKWRYLAHFVGFIDFFCSSMLAVMVIPLGLYIHKRFLQQKNEIEKLYLADNSQFQDVSDAIWFCIVLALLIFTFVCLFLLCNSSLLAVATKKDVDPKVAVKKAVAWRNNMTIFLIIISVLFCITMLTFNFSPYILRTVIVIIFIRAIFLDIGCLFVKELEQCIIASGSKQPSADLDHVTVVDTDNKLNEVKISTISGST